ncbi:DUF6114 domain-containing protein [Streptomyces sp. NPDC047928]|uniref:DUF6114 domain-containing protein n=1 Tax=unclassified Streptomyces TaxID=2593676 RepID=UPI003710101C
MPSPVDRPPPPKGDLAEHTSARPAPAPLPPTRTPAIGRRGPRSAWRRWRRSRPFWGGLITVLAGAEICAIPLAPLKVMLHQGVAGVPSILLGLVMIMLGVSVWVAPQYRSMAGLVTTLIAAAALVMSNLGGFLLGTLLGIVGGAMTFAWRPHAPAPPGAADPTDQADPTDPADQAHQAEPTHQADPADQAHQAHQAEPTHQAEPAEPAERAEPAPTRTASDR